MYFVFNWQRCSWPVRLSLVLLQNHVKIRHFYSTRAHLIGGSHEVNFRGSLKQYLSLARRERNTTPNSNLKWNSLEIRHLAIVEYVYETGGGDSGAASIKRCFVTNSLVPPRTADVLNLTGKRTRDRRTCVHLALGNLNKDSSKCFFSARNSI